MILNLNCFWDTVLESEDNKASKLAVDDIDVVGGSNHEQRSACISPASSQGGIYPVSF